MIRTSLFLLFAISYICDVWSEVIQTKQGYLRGKENVSRGGRKYYSFSGIPFAKPPVGNLRFQSPQPHPGWSGVLNATEDGNICVQDMILVPQLAGITLGSEDCLFINVHTHNVQPSKKYPVMVYIFGGAFVMGDGGLSSYGPNYLMDRDIVYVSFNYRLGIFGFLSFQDTHIPGNYALKDQLLAFKWVKENIEAFGGDPNSVTIFGESAGAASVHYHLLSPKSKGLFHRAIMNSGSAFCPFNIVPQQIAKARGETVATLLGCFGNKTQVIRCLRRVDAEKLQDAQLKFTQWSIDPISSFAPVVEVPHPDAFITKYPLYYKTNPNIPILMGINRNEGALWTARLCSNDFLLAKQLNQDWENLLPISTLIRDSIDYVDPSSTPYVTKTLKSFYLNNQNATKLNIGALTDMYSDLTMNFGTIKAAEHASGPVYFYLYGFQSEVSWTSVFGNCSCSLGVCHVDDLINLFKLNTVFPNLQLEGKYLEMSKILVETWTNFVISGIPKDDNDRITSWTEFNRKKSNNYLYIGDLNFTMKSHILHDRMNFIKTLPLQFNYLSSKRKLNKLV